MKLTKPIFIIVTILSSFSLLSQGIQVSGTVEEESSGEAIPNISIVWESSSGKKFSSTNSYGFYSISVSEGSGRLIFSSFGFKTQTKQFRNLNNKVWYALGEFVDNAVQSFEDNKSKFTKVHGDDFVLEVRIKINKDDDIISIKDNAGGIGLDNYYRAFEPAHIPNNNNGLHEYGMGMKTAAIWLSDVS